MATGYPRDLIGYGPNPPDPQWPGGARLALNVVVNYEEGSEYSIPDDDGRSEGALTEVSGRLVAERDDALDDAREEMQAAVDFGLASPFPEPEEATTYVYA